MSKTTSTKKEEEEKKKPTSTLAAYLHAKQCGPIKQNPGNQTANFLFVRPENPLDEALLYLEVTHAHGLPCEGDQGLIGHFGVADLVKYVVGRCDGHDAAWAAKLSSKELLNGHVKDVFPSVEPLLVLKETDSLWDAVKLMVERHGHRVFLLDGGVCTGVVSPSAILAHLAEEKASLDAKQLAQSLDKFGLGTKRAVHCVNSSSTVLDAFRLMVEQRVTGLAVMQGAKVVGGVSVSDVKLVLRQGGALLGKTVDELIKMERAAGVAPTKPVVVDHKHTVGALLEIFGRNHVSRVWVGEHDGTISNTITYSDVLSHLLQGDVEDPTMLWGA